MKILLAMFFLASLLFSKTIEVTASIIPQQYLIEKIAGDKVKVNVMVKKGFSPAVYEPKTSQMRALSTSKIYFSIGVPFENVWLDKFKSANSSMMIVDTSKGIEKLEMVEHNHEAHAVKANQDEHDDHHAEHKHEEHATKDKHDEHDDHDEHKHEEHKHDNHDEDKHAAHDHADGLDPHVWLDPILLKKVANNVLKALVKVDKENASFYKVNYEILVKELDNLNKEIATILKPFKHKAFMVFHPSWGYFAKRYDLEQIAVEKQGKEPKPKELVELIDEAKKHDIKVVFVAPQFSKKAAKSIAKSINGDVVFLDPLSKEYVANLLNVAKGIKKSYQ